MTEKLEYYLQKKLAVLEKAGLTRILQTCSPLGGPLVELAGKKLIDFASHDYLGLGSDSRVIQAAIDALSSGVSLGAGGSRLVSGSSPMHQSIEAQVAKFLGSERALYFSSGFAANFGVIGSLMGSRGIIFSDQSNHSSIIQGQRSSGATVCIYPHLDYAALRTLLEEKRSQYQNALLVSESLYSMQGDLADLKILQALAAEFGVWLMLDEAHSFGLYGSGGRGLAAQAGIVPDISVITASKALGVQGAFVCGSARLCAFLAQRASSFMYSTSSPSHLLAAIGMSLVLLAEGDLLRERLMASCADLQGFLQSRGMIGERALSPIFPILCASNEEALERAAFLRSRSIYVVPIRRPTVPQAQLRIVLSALHDPEQLSLLKESLGEMLFEKEKDNV